MRILRILVVGVVFSILSLGIPLNADAALNAYLKLKGPIKLGVSSSGYVLSGADAEKAMQAINALKRDCCSCSKVGKEIICKGKGTSDCCLKTLKSLQAAIPIKPTKPSAPAGLSTSGTTPSAPTGLRVTGTTPSHPPPAIGYTPEVPFTVTGQPPKYNLVITRRGGGGGTVTSSPSGISCGPECTTYTGGSTVALTATPLRYNSFSGWGGHCSGIGTCILIMNAQKNVTAIFTPPEQQIPVDRSSGDPKCPEHYYCRSRHFEADFICQWDNDQPDDCYEQWCISRRDCAKTVARCRNLRTWPNGTQSPEFHRFCEF
jgi:hypothetical protein